MDDNFSPRVKDVIAYSKEEALRLGHNFIGTELDPKLSYAKIAEACGFKGVKVTTQSELTEALKTSCVEQMNGITTLLKTFIKRREFP